MSNRRGLPPIFGVLLLVVGGTALVLFGSVAHSWYLAVVSKNWPAVPGKILYSRLRGGDFAAGRGIVRVKHADIVYRYTVHERDYTAHVDLGFNDEDPQGTVQQYPVGTAVVVHYNPSNPSRSVLEPRFGLHRTHWLGIGVFYTVWIGFGLLCVFNGLSALCSHKRRSWR